MSGQFSGKVAFITGAGTGIGEATAELLAERGAKVTLVGIDEAAVRSVAARIEKTGGEALAIGADVSDHDAMRDAVAATVDRFGGLHLAVNNAGIGCSPKPLGELEVEEWRRVTGVNYDGVFYGMRHQLPAIEASGGGAIVVTSSMYWQRGLPLRAAYSGSKHGVVGVVRATAIDYANRGIRVNAVAPGVTDTPLLDSGREHTEMLKQMIPMRRLGSPRELAQAIAFLLSDEASYITGAVLGVDGGITA